MRKHLNLYTHDGLFHADEVFATAMFQLIAEEINVVRGSDTEIPEDTSDWIVYDIGGGELDHHTPENKENNGFHPGTEIPYAAFGLVWRKYYQEVLEEMDCPERYYDRVYAKLEASLILGIDAQDNGVNTLMESLNRIPNMTDQQRKQVLYETKTGMSVSQVIKDFNPPWNSDLDQYEAFMDAVSFARDILVNRIDSIISSLDGQDYVQRCIDYSANHIMIMDEFAPWEGFLYSQSRYNPKAQDIWYVVSPALRGGWNVHCVLKDSDNRSEYRHPLPEEWYGLRYEELQKVSGVETAIFCHVSGFLAGAQTQADAITMASIGVSYEKQRT